MGLSVLRMNGKHHRCRSFAQSGEAKLQRDQLCLLARAVVEDDTHGKIGSRLRQGNLQPLDAQRMPLVLPEVRVLIPIPRGFIIVIIPVRRHPVMVPGAPDDPLGNAGTGAVENQGCSAPASPPARDYATAGGPLASGPSRIARILAAKAAGSIS
jgi:hypothetical protein